MEDAKAVHPLNEDPSSEDSSTEEPPSKKLRSSEPDLQVTIQYTEDGIEQRKSYDMYAQVLARQSKFVDTMLSVEMREKMNGQVVLHDVLPDVFESALKLLEDPVAVLSMTEVDAMKVVEFYDKFEFKEGLVLCDKILQKYMRKAADKPGAPDDLEFAVDVMAASFHFGLKSTVEEACGFLFRRVWGFQKDHFGVEMFSLEHIRKLHPLIGHYVREEKMSLPFDVTDEELSSPLFPKYFVETVAHQYDSKLLKAIVVCGSQSTTNGKYIRKEKIFEGEPRPTSWNGRLAQCFIQKTSDTREWAIICRYLPNGGNEVVLWKSPHSQNLNCPPTGPWEFVENYQTRFIRATCPTARPIIKYIKFEEKSS